MISGYRFTVFASDLARSRRFYEDQLGCAIADETELGFTARREGLEMVVEGGATRRRLGKGWLGEGGLYITVVSDDFDALIADLTERDAPFLDDVVEATDGKRVTGIADPDGVLFEIREA